MGTTLTASFATRREAEMTVERLVQEIGVERTDVFIAASGAENTVGDVQAGSDTEAGAPTPEDRGDAPLEGQITVSVDLDDEGQVERVRNAFTEFDAVEIAAD